MRERLSPEQAACRQRTDEEHEAVQTSTLARELSEEIYHQPHDNVVRGDSSAG